MSARRIHPVQGVHLAFVEGDGVVLDLRSDAYFCLPDLRAVLTPMRSGGLEAEAEDSAMMLLDSGLFAPAAVGGSLAGEPPSAPRRSSRDQTVGRGDALEKIQFALATCHAARTFPGRGLQALLRGGSNEGAAAEPSVGPDLERAGRRAVLFDRWLPWVPAQGRCLYRAYALRRFLRADGLGARWVFGVRTWPFSAHCWLQAGDVLLDDDLDRVGLYTPILWV
jgi:hypothetical protein